MKILIIENNKNLAISIADYLEAQSHVVDFADNGQSGMNLATKNMFDAIVLDINLPVLDGLTLCNRLRTQARQNLPILMISARDTLTDRPCSNADGVSLDTSHLQT
jgi:DNA-binding response OmpR family regulator